MARGNGLIASRTRSMATSMSNPRLVLNRGQSLQIDAADNALDVGFFDRQIVQRIALGDFGDQLGGRGFQAIELQPAARAIGAYLTGGSYDKWTSDIVDKVDDEGTFRPEPIANAIERA